MHPAAAPQRSTEPSALTIRAAEAGDAGFLLSSWRQNFWRESPWGKRLTWAVFSGGHTRVIQALLARSSVLVARVNAPDTSPEQVDGFLVWEPARPAVHWCYVRPEWRRARRAGLLPQGIATALLAASGLPMDLRGVSVTHGTWAWLGTPPRVDKRSGKELEPGKPGISSRCPEATHNPYLWVHA